MHVAMIVVGSDRIIIVIAIDLKKKDIFVLLHMAKYDNFIDETEISIY